MKTFIGLLAVVFLSMVHGEPEVDVMGGGVVRCLSMIANDTEFEAPPADEPVSKNFTQKAFKSICKAKDKFVKCIDENLSSSENEISTVFRPLFDKLTVSEAYAGLCDNLTLIEEDDDLSCLMNTTSLMPCYSQYNTYIGYLSVVIRFGSKERQLSNSVTKTLVCALAERRTQCEVEVLRGCSQTIGDIMSAFYEKSLPSVCREGKETTN
ncbi:uncharacterized protein [Haliotis cracherodii]|uniref:uncharacterized protein n=1 Tax=Haliotis cracherodii TaxID=6455 RepID=UPI0039E883EA